MAKEHRIIALTRDEIGSGAGDNSNARSNRDSVARIYHARGTHVSTAEYNIKALEKLKEEIATNKDKQYIIIGVGDEGAKAIHSLNSKEAITLVLSHQATLEVLNAASYAKVIGISAHAVSDKQREFITSKAIFASLIGASSTLTQAEIESHYKAMQDVFAPEPTTLGVLFGGDAKTPLGDTKILSPENAVHIGRVVATEASKCKARIVLTDGPRAGAHLGRKDGEINPVIEAFKKGVSAADPKIEVIYSPFIQDPEARKNNPSAYRAIFMGCSKIFYTMESISTGYELAMFKDVLGKGVAIESESTLDDHKAFAHWLYNKGYVNLVLFKDGKQVDMPIESVAREPLDRDYNAKSLVDAIDRCLNPQVVPGFADKEEKKRQAADSSALALA